MPDAIRPSWSVLTIPNLVLRFVLACAFFAGACALLDPAVAGTGAEPAWLPQDHGWAVPLACVLIAIALPLLVGWGTRKAALSAGLLVVVLLAVHLRRDHLVNTATHLVPWLACAVGLLLLPTAGTLSVDAWRRSGGPGGEEAWSSAATLLVRIFLGAIFTVQGFHSLFVVGPLAFAKAVYVEPFAKSAMPAALLWLAGVANPFLQLSAGVLLLLGVWTRGAAAAAALFLCTIVFGHVLLDPLLRGPDIHDYALANLLLATLVLVLAGRGERGDRFSVSGLIKRLRTAAVLALPLVVLACAAAEVRPHAPKACRPETATLLAEARARVQEGGLDAAWAAGERFEEAARLDPQCETALVEWALVIAGGPIIFSGPGHHLSAKEGYPRAARLAERAAELDDADARPHLVLALRALYLDYDWCRARAELDAAAQRDPKEPRVRVLRSYLRVILGEEAQALADLEELRGVDGAAVSASLAEGVIHYMRHRPARAVSVFADVVRREPSRGIAHFWLGMALVQAGQAAAGVVELERCVALTHRNPGALASLAQGYAAAGRPEDARAVLRELADRASSEVIVLYQNAAAHLALGERGRALDLLERAVHEDRDNWPTWLGLDPRFAALAEEPRFQGLIAEMGFERGRICAR